jgi:hypothetical protein
MMPGNGINYEKCNSRKKIVKKKFFFVFFSSECCTHKLIKKTMKNLKITQNGELYNFHVRSVHKLSKKVIKEIFETLKTEQFTVHTPNRTYTYNKNWLKYFNK